MRLYWTQLDFWQRATLLLGGILLALALATFRQYGVTWDEDVHNGYGNFVLDFYLSGFREQRALSWLNLYLYGAGFDMIAAALNRFSPLGVYETRHLLNALVGCLGLVGAYKLGHALGRLSGAKDTRTGFIALALLAATPNYYGQMFNNPKDIPFAVGAVWSVYYLVRVIPHLPRPPMGLVVKLGVAIGLSLGVRVGALLLPIYVGCIVGAHALWRALEQRRLQPLLAESAAATIGLLLPMLVLAYPIMLLFWPWAQIDPLNRPLQSLSYFSHVTFPYDTLFAGGYYPAEHLPRLYLPTFVLLNLPELTLVLVILAVPAAAWQQCRRPGGPDRATCLAYLALALAIVTPIAYAVAIRAVLFDGMRHFIFVLPPLAVAASLVLDRLISALKNNRFRYAIAGLGAVYAVDHMAIMLLLHPDEYVYYNGLVGGVAGAQSLFKTDYWGNSFREATLGLVRWVRAQPPGSEPAQGYTVSNCGPPVSVAYYLPPDLHWTEDQSHADFFIAFTKDGCDRLYTGTEIVRVERMGALLSLVLDRRAHSAAASL